MGGAHCNEEEPVKAAVSTNEGLIANVGYQVHNPIIAQGFAKNSPFSDMGVSR
jgi:hypothetical protein